MSSKLDLLIEVLAKPYKYLGNILPGDGTRKFAFQPNGRNPFIVIVKTHGGGKISEIHFEDDNQSDAKTGKGDAFQILSTVIQIAKDYVKKIQTIEEFWIIAKEEEEGSTSRAKLYKALIEKFAENEGFKLAKTEQLEKEGLFFVKYVLRRGNAAE